MKKQFLGIMALTLMLTTVGMVGAIGFESNNDKVGIGIASPTAKLEIVGDGATSATKALEIFDTGSTNSLFMVRDDGNVGIGTTSPNTLLELKSTTSGSILTLDSNLSSHHAGINFKVDGTSKWDLRTTGVTDNIGFYDGSTYHLYIDRPTGNVGIGTTVPDDILHVLKEVDVATADVYSTPLVLEVEDPTGGLWQGTGVGIKFNLKASDIDFTPAEILSIAPAAGTTDGILAFRTAKTGTLATQMTIDEDGNVGIGTTTPSATVSTYNSSTITGSTLADGSDMLSLGFKIYTYNTQRDFSFRGWSRTITGAQAPMMSIMQNDVAVMTFEGNQQNGSGRVGIGTDLPVEQLYVNSDSGDSRIGLNAPASSDTEIKFSNAGTVEYTIGHDDGTDNFVIGTTNVDTPVFSITKAGLPYFPSLAGSTGGSDMRYNTSTGQMYYDTSAKKYKTNVRDVIDTSFIYDIAVVEYDRVDGSKDNEIGIIADELEKINDSFVYYDKNGEVEGYNKSDLVPAILNELQNLQAEVSGGSLKNVSLKNSDALSPSGRVIRVSGQGGSGSVLSSTPSIEAGNDGQVIILQGTDDSKLLTLQDESNLANSGLQLSGGFDFTLGQGDTLQLIYDAGDGKWYEITRSDN